MQTREYALCVHAYKTKHFLLLLFHQEDKEGGVDSKAKADVEENTFEALEKDFQEVWE